MTSPAPTSGLPFALPPLPDIGIATRDDGQIAVTLTDGTVTMPLASGERLHVAIILGQVAAHIGRASSQLQTEHLRRDPPPESPTGRYILVGSVRLAGQWCRERGVPPARTFVVQYNPRDVHALRGVEATVPVVRLADADAPTWHQKPWREEIAALLRAQEARYRAATDPALAPQVTV